jgi:hypothetical protein
MKDIGKWAISKKILPLHPKTITNTYDDYKKAFYQKCTPAYTAEWVEKIKQLRLWIKTML